MAFKVWVGLCVPFHISCCDLCWPLGLALPFSCLCLVYSLSTRLGSAWSCGLCWSLHSSVPGRSNSPRMYPTFSILHQERHLNHHEMNRLPSSHASSNVRKRLALDVPFRSFSRRQGSSPFYTAWVVSRQVPRCATSRRLASTQRTRANAP